MELTYVKYITNIARSYYHRFDAENNRIEIHTKADDGTVVKATFSLLLNRGLKTIFSTGDGWQIIEIDDLDKFVNRSFTKSRKLKKLSRYLNDLVKSPKKYIGANGDIIAW